MITTELVHGVLLVDWTHRPHPQSLEPSWPGLTRPPSRIVSLALLGPRVKPGDDGEGRAKPAIGQTVRALTG